MLLHDYREKLDHVTLERLDLEQLSTLGKNSFRNDFPTLCVLLHKKTEQSPLNLLSVATKHGRDVVPGNLEFPGQAAPGEGGQDATASTGLSQEGVPENT